MSLNLRPIVSYGFCEIPSRCFVRLYVWASFWKFDQLGICGKWRICLHWAGPCDELWLTRTHARNRVGGILRLVLETGKLPSCIIPNYSTIPELASFPVFSGWNNVRCLWTQRIAKIVDGVSFIVRWKWETHSTHFQTNRVVYLTGNKPWENVVVL